MGETRGAYIIVVGKLQRPRCRVKSNTMFPAQSNEILEEFFSEEKYKTYDHFWNQVLYFDPKKLFYNISIIKITNVFIRATWICSYFTAEEHFMKHES
jgi:hypothetical protein